MRKQMGQQREDNAPRLGTALLYPRAGAPSLSFLAQRWLATPLAASPKGAGLREPGRGSTNSDNSEARRELHRILQLAPTRSPLSAAPPPRRNRGQRLVCPLGGSSSRSRWPKASVCAAPPRAERGTARAAGATARGTAPERATVCAQLLAARNQHPSCSPRRCSLPSDRAAQKANGKGASFKVHINLVLVGYSLAATPAVPNHSA